MCFTLMLVRNETRKKEVVRVHSDLGVKIPRFKILSPLTGWSFKIVGDPDARQYLRCFFYLRRAGTKAP